MSYKMVCYFLPLLHCPVCETKNSSSVYMSTHYIFQHYIRTIHVNLFLTNCRHFYTHLSWTWLYLQYPVDPESMSTDTEWNWCCLYWLELQKEDSKKSSRRLTCLSIVPACLEYPPCVWGISHHLRPAFPTQKIFLHLRAIRTLRQTAQ